MLKALESGEALEDEDDRALVAADAVERLDPLSPAEAVVAEVDCSAVRKESAAELKRELGELGGGPPGKDCPAPTLGAVVSCPPLDPESDGMGA